MGSIQPESLYININTYTYMYHDVSVYTVYVVNVSIVGCKRGKRSVQCGI